MSQALTANSQQPQTLSWHRIWLEALIHPAMAIQKLLAQQVRVSTWQAYGWVFAASLIGGAISSLAPFKTQLLERGSIDTLLLALIPVSSLIAVCSLAAFAWCTQKLAQMLKGSGTYQQLVCVFATFSAPLLITASILSLILPARVLLAVLYIYWIALYVVAVRAVNGISRMKAIAAVLIGLLLLGFIWLGGAFIVAYWGMLLP